MENWKAFPGLPRYEVSDLGRVRKGDFVYKLDKGKIEMRLGGRRVVRSVARAVLKAFGDLDCLPIAISKADGDRNNCRLSNLVRRDYSGGIFELPGYEQRKAKNLIHRGTANGSNVLTEAQVLEIHQLEGTASQRSLAQQYRVSRSTILSIFNGWAWSWLTGRTKAGRKGRPLVDESGSVG